MESLNENMIPVYDGMGNLRKRGKNLTINLSIEDVTLLKDRYGPNNDTDDPTCAIMRAYFNDLNKNPNLDTPIYPCDGFPVGVTEQYVTVNYRLSGGRNKTRIFRFFIDSNGQCRCEIVSRIPGDFEDTGSGPTGPSGGMGNPGNLGTLGATNLGTLGATTFGIRQPVISANSIFMSGNPQTAGLSGDPNFSGGVCLQFTYTIGTPQIIKTDKLIGRVQQQVLSLHSDHKDLLLNAKECVLIAPVYECCWIQSPTEAFGVRISNGSSEVGWVELARSRPLISYEECEINGKLGKRPVVLGYFDLEDIINGPNGTIVGPTKNPSNPLKFFNAGINIGGEIWANCFGKFGGRVPTNLWSNYIGENQNLFFSLQNIGQIVNESRDGSKYPLIDPNTNGTASNRFGFLSGFDCQESGECKELPAPPPPPPPNVTETYDYCVTLNSLDTANQIDDGSHVINSGNAPSWASGKNLPRFFRPTAFEILTSTQILKRLPNTRVRGQRENLASFGLPCETGILETEFENSELVYRKVIVCYRIRNDRGVISVDRIVSQQVLTDEFGSIPQPSVPIITGAILDQSSRQYDKNAGCCEKLNWSTDRVIGGVPPKDRAYLDHDLNTSESVLTNSCGCELITIADIWCYYNGSKKSLHKKKNIDDKDTHVGKPVPVADERCLGDKSRVFHLFDVRKDISFSRRKDKTAGLFDGKQNLDCYITSSVTSSTSNYYFYDVNDCLDCSKYPYFAVSYGNYNGSGSVPISLDADTNNKTFSDTVYSQYQILCNEVTYSNAGTPVIPKFKFVSQSIDMESDDIYAINFYREGITDKLDPGNFQINLAYLSGSFYGNSVHTGSNVKVGGTGVMQFIDNSGDFSQGFLCQDQLLEVYDIVSGSLENGIYENASVNSYGKVYPALGIIAFHPKRLNEMLGFNTVTGSNINGDNAYKLFTSISGAATPFGSRTTRHEMLARNVSFSVSHHYSVRVSKGIANYSNNPTYVTGSKNKIFDSCFINQPQSYITSVGLYNENLELLAIAKLTRPLKKDFDSDLLIKIRLNW
jgi:hypothetical protein